MFINSFIYLFIYLFVYLFIYLFICLFIYLFIHSFIFILIFFLMYDMPWSWFCFGDIPFHFPDPAAQAVAGWNLWRGCGSWIILPAKFRSSSQISMWSGVPAQKKTVDSLMNAFLRWSNFLLQAAWRWIVRNWFLLIDVDIEHLRAPWQSHDGASFEGELLKRLSELETCKT